MLDSDDEITPPSRAAWHAFLSATLIAFSVGILMAQPLVERYTGYTLLVDSAKSLIDESMLDNQRTFLVISAVKASLALVEGSTVGVGVEVQVGDLIQPAYDYVDYFWKVFLTAFVIMGFYKILLDAGILTMGFPILAVGLIVLAISNFVPGNRWNARSLARKLILIGILMTHAVPLALLASDQISTIYVAELKGQHQENIASFQRELDVARTDFLALKEELSLLNPGVSLERIETRLIALASTIASAFQLTFLSFMYFVLIVLVEMLILPFCTAFILYQVGRRLLDGLVVPTIPLVQVVSSPALTK